MLENPDYIILQESGHKGAEGDRDWHERVDITFEINPGPPPPHPYFAMQQEYGIRPDQDGRCRHELAVRKALAYSCEHHVFDRTIGPNA